jgi:N-acyl-L-homoserine lactone synthetase
MGSSGQLGVDSLKLMYAFRYDVFVTRLGWSLPLRDGVERDQYDGPNARYVVQSEGSDCVTACARLLPTVQSYMLPELFPQLLGGRPAPRDASIWELSRFATSVRHTHEGRILCLSKPTVDFLDLVLCFARRERIARLIFVTSIGIERLMLRARVPVHRIGPPALIDGRLHVALFIEVRPQAAATQAYVAGRAGRSPRLARKVQKEIPA